MKAVDHNDISYMPPAQLKAIMLELYPDCEGPQRRLAEELHTTEVTVSRWMTGFNPIQPQEAKLIRLIYLLHLEGVRWRKKYKEMFETAKLDGML